MSQTRPQQVLHIQPNVVANKALIEKFFGCIKDPSDTTIKHLKIALHALRLEQDTQAYQDNVRQLIACAYAAAYIVECSRGGLMSKTQKGKGSLKILDDALEAFNKLDSLFKKYEDCIPDHWRNTTEGYVFMSACDNPVLSDTLFEKTLLALFHNNREQFVNCMMALEMTGRTGLGLWDRQVKTKLQGNLELHIARRLVTEKNPKMAEAFFTEEYLRNELYPDLQDNKSTAKAAVSDYFKRLGKLPEEKIETRPAFFKPPKTKAQLDAARAQETAQLEELHRNYPDLEL